MRKPYMLRSSELIPVELQCERPYKTWSTEETHGTRSVSLTCI